MTGNRVTRTNLRGKSARYSPDNAPDTPLEPALDPQDTNRIEELSTEDEVDDRDESMEPDPEELGRRRLPEKSQRAPRRIAPGIPPAAEQSSRSTIGLPSGRPNPSITRSGTTPSTRFNTPPTSNPGPVPNETFIQPLILKAYEAEAQGASPAEVKELINRASVVSQMLLRPVGLSTEQPRAAHDTAGKLMGILNKVQPKPKLGNEHWAPTPQHIS